MTRSDRAALPPTGAPREAADPATFRHALGHFLTGVTVATTVGPAGEPVGMTANAFTSVSLDPPLVLLCLDRSAASFAAMEQAARYAVHILHDGQDDVSRSFARSAADGAEKFAGVAWFPAPDGLPLLSDCLARLECTIIERIPLGDHVGYLGRVDATGTTGGLSPLAFFRGGYANLSPTISDLTSGPRGQRALVRSGGHLGRSVDPRLEHG